MEIISEIRRMKAVSRELKRENKTIGFVPTMGYLHEGHLSLVREAKRQAEVVVVSIFVNPIQFGPQEDFNRYPRDFKRDQSLLEEERVDYLFYPDVNEMYPRGYKTYVEVRDLQDRLCGKSRPGHFRGVSTVVLKLFNIIQPDVVFFGWKDAQQFLILKKMVDDLNLDTSIVALPIVRDDDGLALSSRNSYLNAEERKAALVLNSSLKEAVKMVESGERRADVIISRVKAMIENEPLARIDYVEIVELENLLSVKRIKGKALIALAVFVGKARLIDNIIVEV